MLGQDQSAPGQAGLLQAQVALVRASGLFDATWYLQTYPDVAMSGLEPLEHYLRFGALLGRNPGPAFDAARYLKSHPELLRSGDNPLVHHLSRRGGLAAATPGGADARLKGYLDRLDGQGFAGWAVDTSRPGESVALSVFVDGEHLMDLDTGDDRPDLARHGFHGARAGFSYSWPSSLFPQGTEIDVRFKRTGWSLTKSPRVVLYGPLVECKERSHVLDEYNAGRMAPVSVVVPVFNAFEAVAACLDALLPGLPEYAEAVLVDDASTDPRIAGLLARHAAAHPRARVLANAQNLGYTRTINRAIASAPGRDVVLLNSDTEVTGRWLDALRYCAYARPKVATVTALSDNAGAFSVPAMGRHNPRPDHLDREGFARVVVGATSGKLLEVPTGNGFCMYIRREALEQIGGFDEQRYPRGYGEENDFCVRALRSGWRNIVSDKAFVLHKRSQSFQGEKEALMKAGRRQLDQDYPEYGLLISRFRDIEFSRMRQRVGAALQANARRPLPRALYVISTQTGGTPQTNLDLMRAMSDRYDCWLLRCDSRVVTLWELVNGSLEVRETHHLERFVDPVTHRSDDYDQVVADLLYRRSIGLLHVRHVAWHSLNLARIAMSQNIPVVYSFHDFYSVCPSLNLLDNDLKYCGGRCTQGDGHCTNSLWPSSGMPELKHRFVHRWREMVGEFISDCDAFITTVPTAARTLEQAYPQLQGRITVIPHGRDFQSPASHARLPEGKAKVRILVPGNIGASKGSELFRRLAEIGAGDRYEFHFLGATAGILKGIGIHHGTYDRNNFHREVRKIAPAFGVVFSIWAETYCHTLTEMWSCGVPVLGMDIGAVGDRIRASGGGWLIDPASSAEEVLRKLDEISGDLAGHADRIEAVRAWQASEAVWNDTATMASQYQRVYARASGRKELEGNRLGLLYRQNPYVPATAFIRCILPWRGAMSGTSHDVRAVDAQWLLAGGLDHVDALVIQRDAVPPALVDDLLARLRERRIPYCYEIDDPLWELSEEHADHGIYAPQREGIVRMIREAAVVTTSTPAMRQQLQALTPGVELVGTTLDPTLWRAPLDPGWVTQVLGAAGLASKRPRILYMGTSSHAVDLRMVLPAIEAVMAVNPALEFIQVGAGEALPGAKLLAVPEDCGPYPQFVKWFRAVCSAATIGVAPLQDNAFNAAKSDIKALDYALGGLPAVFSAVGPYKASIEHGRNGLLVDNDTGSWIMAITRLLDDAGLRDEIRTGASAWARERDDRTEEQLRLVAAEAFGWKARA